MKCIFSQRVTFTSVRPIIDPMDECFAVWPPEDMKEATRTFHFVPVVIDLAVPMREHEGFVVDNFHFPKGEAEQIGAMKPCMCAVLKVPNDGDPELGPVGFHFGQYGRAWPIDGCAPTYTGDLYRDGELVERGREWQWN